jgi:AcrR family transcriptional regulator
MACEDPMDSSAPELRSERQQQIVDVAWRLLTAEGRDALTMRRLANELGIKAPSLYKHFPDKQAVEAALIDRGFLLWGNASRQAVAQPGDPLASLARAYREVATEQPHLYRLMTDGALDRSRLTPGIEGWSAEPLGKWFADPETARAFWGFLHGMAILEIDGRFPSDAQLDRSWGRGVAAFSAIAQS